MMPVRRPMKTSPPAWNSPMNHCAASASTPKRPVGLSTDGPAANTTFVAIKDSDIVTPRRAGQLMLASLMLQGIGGERGSPLGCHQDVGRGLHPLAGVLSISPVRRGSGS